LNFENSFQKRFGPLMRQFSFENCLNPVPPTPRPDNMDAVFEHPALPADLWAVFVHESGHLVTAHRLGLPVNSVEIREEGGHSDIKFSQGRLGDYMVGLLSGETAEVEVFGRQMLPRVHAGSDRERLYLAVVRAGALGQQELFVARQKVKRLVHMHRGAIIRLATELLAIATDEGVMVDGPRLADLLDADGSAILRRAAV
jgi:hypothetical protein